MKNKTCPIFVVVALATLLLTTFAQAEICRVLATVSITTFEEPEKENRLDIFLSVFDSNQKRPPDIVKWVKVQMPDKSRLDLTNTWNEYDQIYESYTYASDLPGGVIQSGMYAVAVKDSQTGKVIYVTNRLDTAQVLIPPQITYPSEGETVGSLTPTITWMQVPRAACYRLFLLRSFSCGGPYNYPDDKIPYIDGKTTYFNVPKGVLKSGQGYQVQVEALSENAYWDYRGRSMWVNFFTP